MSLLKSNSVQIGQSVTATNNFTLSVPASPDGTIKLARGNSGATTADILTVDASGNVTTTLANGIVTPAKLSQPMTQRTQVTAPTASSLIQYTGIPSWVKRITLMFRGISINGNNHILVLVGTSTNLYLLSGYSSQLSITNTGSSTAASTSGFIMHWPEANSASHGTMTLSYLGNNGSGDIWTSSGTFAWHGGSTASTIFSGGSVQLPSGTTLDRVAINSANGSDYFDAGSVNIIYEG